MFHHPPDAACGIESNRPALLSGRTARMPRPILGMMSELAGSRTIQLSCAAGPHKILRHSGMVRKHHTRNDGTHVNSRAHIYFFGWRRAAGTAKP
jgi:hypothetical protein